MTRTRLLAAGIGAALLILALAIGYGARGRRVAAAEPPRRAPAGPAPATAPRDAAGFIYGRVTTKDGTVHEGRLRWGGGEEAFWSDFFNGVKAKNRWAELVPKERLEERRSLTVFGIRIASWKRTIDLGRPFMARFGDLVRIEAHGRELKAVLKSGTTVDLDRFAADDFADGLRVFGAGGVRDLDEWQVVSVEFLPAPPRDAVPARLHGTVIARQGEFSGFLAWNRHKSVGSDRLEGRSAEGAVALPFETIRTITRQPFGGARVTLEGGGEILLEDDGDAGLGHRGLFVDDPRYGRVLVPWEAVERVAFDRAGSGPGYDAFPPGRPLSGTVATREGRSLSGRLVFDLDESETTDTLDAPFDGLTYSIPFGRIASITLPEPSEEVSQPATVTLHGGETLRLDPAGDLGAGNGGLLVFTEGSTAPEYVRWADVGRIRFERPAKRPASPR